MGGEPRARFDALRSALRAALLEAEGLVSPPPLCTTGDWMLLNQATKGDLDAPPAGQPSSHGPSHGSGDGEAVSSATDAAEQSRLIALVELARGGDKEAFGLLYDHYQPSVHRYLYYRLGTVALAEDLTGETFFRALRSMNNFRWQGRDFGAWLMTIARNLVTDHYKSSRTRLERSTDDLRDLEPGTDAPAAPESPETAVMTMLTNEALLESLRGLPRDQQDCLVMRFLHGMSLAETAKAMERTAGAIKQLQLRAVRNLAAALPEGVRP